MALATAELHLGGKSSSSSSAAAIAHTGLDTWLWLQAGWYAKMLMDDT